MGKELFLRLGVGVVIAGLTASSILQMSAPAQAAVCVFSDPTPLPNADFRIDTAADLDWLRRNSSAWTSAWTQTANIDMGGCEWTAGIGTSAFKFTGVYDGGGFTISGLDINMIGVNNAGLFGYLGTGGEIRNLGYTGNVSALRYVGGLVGRADFGRVTNSFTTGTVIASDQDVGGLIGYSNGTSVSGSYATGDVTGGSDGFAGGLIGVAERTTVSSSYASGDVTAGTNVGGLIGNTYGGGSYSRVYATGNVVGAAPGGRTQIGGLIGWATDPVSDAYATGSVTGAINVGGLAGYTSSSGTVTRSYSTGDVSASVTNFGGLVGLADAGVTASFRSGIPEFGTGTNPNQGTFRTTAQMQDISTFVTAAWNITAGWTSGGSIWGICPLANDGTPILIATYSADPCTSSNSDASVDQDPSPPIVVFQAVPLPDSGNCTDVIDADFAYGTGLSGGWQRGWQMWVEPPGIGGYACVRALVKVPGKPWRVDNSAM